MTRPPAVSVVMPVRDPDPRFFPAAIGSLLAQTFPDIEILVVEDAGPRPGGAPVRPVAAALAPLAEPRIRHVRNPIAGIASARNRGLAEARADVIAMHDADDVSAPERLAVQLARLREEPDLVLVGSHLRILDGDDVETGSRRYPTAHADIVRIMPVYNPIAQPSVMLRKDAVAAVGGYRDRCCEDYDLWSRLALAGMRFANLDAALVGYRVHPAAMKTRKLRASLRDTLDIKRELWRGRQTLPGRLRILGEHALLLLPPALVLALFERMYLRSGARR